MTQRTRTHQPDWKQNSFLRGLLSEANMASSRDLVFLRHHLSKGTPEYSAGAVESRLTESTPQEIDYFNDYPEQLFKLTGLVPAQ